MVTPIPKIDPHIDIADLYKHFGLSQEDFYSTKDIPVSLAKLENVGVKIVGATLYVDESFVTTSYYDGVKDFSSWYESLIGKSDVLRHITSFGEFNEGDDNIYVFHSIEGFQCLRKPEDIDEFYEMGVRSFGMTWSGDNDYACGRHTKRDVGISKFGKEVLARLSNKRCILDIAHLSERSVQDLSKLYSGMIVTTHGNVRSVYNSTHNLTDEEIQLIVDRGGVVSLFPLSGDTGEEGTFEELYRHVDYIASKWGDDYVAFSSDIYPLDKYPFLEGYKDVTVLNGIERKLLDYMDVATVRKLFYDNWKRVLSEAL